MAVFPYLQYGLHNAIKLFAIVTFAAASTTLTLADICPRICSCYDAAVDCTGKGLKIITDTLPRQTKILILDDNHLDDIPDLSYLVYLEKLVLSRNNIKRINTTCISRLSTLKELDLSRNKINSLPLNTFRTRNKLQKLDLSYNNLTDISGLSSSLLLLKHLNLQHNRIQTLNVIRTNTMPKLNVLRAGHNEIKELVSSLDKNLEFPRLHVLELNNNKIERIHMFLTRFKYIRKLVLSHNKLRSINASSFIQNKDMEELWLDHNELSSVTKLWLTFKPKLSHLDLSYNQIHSVHSASFQSAQNIKYLDVSNNQLGSLETKIFFHLRNLSYLSLHNNEIEVVSELAFFNLNKLLSLNVSCNRMNLGDKEFDNVFTPLTSLKILDLNNNNILLIPSHAFAGLSHLKTLYMKNNKIKVIESNAFSELKAITKMHFDSEDLVCDCSLKYLRNYIKKTSHESQIRVMCSSPLWLKGRNVTDVLDSEVVCEHTMKPMVRPIIYENPKSKYVHLHGNTTLHCVATSSVDSQMTINWYQQLHSRVKLRRATFTSKQEVMVGSQMFRRSSVLSLENIGFRDGGQYWCHVSNLYGSDWSRESNITVVVRPSLSPDLKNSIEARSGSDVLIPCSAEGVPQPSVQFTKCCDDKINIFHAVLEKRIVYKQHRMWIEKLKIEDSGVYTCTARSAVGVANATIQLVVIEKPKFIRPLKSRSYTNGSTVVIDCIISGNPRPTTTWYKNGVQLKQSTNKLRLSNQLLVIMSFDDTDEGQYSCQASNRLGSVRATAMLTVRPQGLTIGTVSEMASDVFIIIIVVVVVVVIILTSLAWLVLIYFCRKRRNNLEEKNSRGEALLAELPKDYVLRCNGKLVSVKKSDEICDEPSEALLPEKHHSRTLDHRTLDHRTLDHRTLDHRTLDLRTLDDHRTHFYGIPMLGNRAQTDNEDDSGVSLVYSKSYNPRDSLRHSSRESRDLSKYPLEPGVTISTLQDEISSSHNNTNNYQLNKSNDNIINNKKDSINNFSSCEKEWRKSKPPSLSSTYHQPSKQGSFIDTNSHCDDDNKFLQKKPPSESNRMTNKNNIDFDPARLKLHMETRSVKRAPNIETRFTNFSSDSVQDAEDYYHNYVTSSSGIESGGSSENISLNSEEIIPPGNTGVVAV